MENSLNNPIMNSTKYHSDGTSVINITLQNVSKYFNCVYVLIKKTDDQVPINFYMKEIFTFARLSVNDFKMLKIKG